MVPNSLLDALLAAAISLPVEVVDAVDAVDVLRTVLLDVQAVSMDMRPTICACEITPRIRRIPQWFTASTPSTARSSAPRPAAMSASMRAAIDGNAANGNTPAVSIINRTSLRAISSSKLGV